MREKIRNLLIWIYSIPINYKVFPKEIARKLPLRISYKTKCKGLYRGCIEIKCNNIYKGMIQFGMPQGSFGMDMDAPSWLLMERGARIVFFGPADFSATASVRVFENGLLEIREGFFSNANASINVSKRVVIGANAQWGWNVEIIDTDGHDIKNAAGEKINPDEEIIIGDDVWIGAKASVLKGSVIPDGCIVGYGSIVSKKYTEPHVVMAGAPAKVIKKDIYWSREKSK